MKAAILALGFSAIVSAREIRLNENQPLIDAFLRQAATDTQLPCRNGTTVTIHGNSAFLGDESFDWIAEPAQGTHEDGGFLLFLHKRKGQQTKYGYWETHPICTYADYPALFANYWRQHQRPSEL